MRDGAQLGGVLIRTRSARKHPSRPTIAAFSPVPPMSMARTRLTAVMRLSLCDTFLVRRPARDAAPGLLAADPSFLTVNHQVQCTVDQSDMRKRLGEIPQHAFFHRIVFLGIKPDIIGQSLQPVEQPERLLAPAHEGVIVHQQEGAGQEGSLARWQTINPGTRLVAAHQPLANKALFDLSHGRLDTLVRGGKKTNQRQKQQRRIQILAAVMLHEIVPLGIHTVLADVAMNAPRHAAPMRPLRRRYSRRTRSTIESHPGHHLGMHEMLPRAAYLPDTLVRQAPDF